MVRGTRNEIFHNGYINLSNLLLKTSKFMNINETLKRYAWRKRIALWIYNHFKTSILKKHEDRVFKLNPGAYLDANTYIFFVSIYV